MQKLIAPKDMAAYETECFAQGSITSYEAMELASGALADAAMQMCPKAERIYIACGPGGNGGDGYACARLLKIKGISVVLFPSAPARHADAVRNEELARALDIPFASANEEKEEPDLWIDCLYGTGLSRCPEGASGMLIDRMNASPAPILAADIPSGLNGITGKAYDRCVHADRTVAFGCLKYGHVLEDGIDMCGATETADVGLPHSVLPAELPELFEPRDIAHVFGKRPRNLHKGKCGHLLIIAGSLGMAGAAVMCTRAALRSGAGLVTVACPAEIVPVLQTLAPQAMCKILPSAGGVITEEAVDILKESMRGKNAVVAGCGWTTRVPKAVLECVLTSGIPSVIDADALNILAANDALKAKLCGHHILTPHIGEAARLLKRPIDSPIADAAAIAGWGAAVVLKSAARVIAGGSSAYVSVSGCCGMARGGSGDCFAGILGALLADPSDPGSPVERAAAACELHGLAGIAAQNKYGSRSMNAADIIEFLPEVFKQYVEC